MISFLLVVLVAGIILMILVGQSNPKAKKRHNSKSNNLNREFVLRKWGEIEVMAQGRGGSLRDAVSEADKLLDYALKNTGAKGETMGERLKNSGSRFSNLNGIWSAHKLRNSLAHEAEFDLVPSNAKEAVNNFRQGLKDLGAL